MKDERFQEAVLQKLGNIETQVGGLDSRVGGLETKVDGLRTTMDRFETRMDGLETKVDGLGNRMDGFETKVDGLGNRMDGFDSNMKKLSTSVDRLREDFDSHREESKMEHENTRKLFEQAFDRLSDTIAIDARVREIERRMPNVQRVRA